MASAGNSGDGEPEFQIAPMIDVLLVLLIFFMSIASTAVTRYDPSIELPIAPDAEKKEDSEGELVFNIAWDQSDRVARVSFEEHPIALDATTQIIANRVSATPGLRVLVRSDGATPVRYVNAIVEAAAKAGVVEVTFAALQR